MSRADKQVECGRSRELPALIEIESNLAFSIDSRIIDARARSQSRS